MEDLPYYWMFSPDLMERRLRLSIFFIIGASAGLPALVWSVGELIDHRKTRHRISVFIILLLLTDFAELFLSPYILIKDIFNEIRCDMDWTCWVFWTLWWSSRACGLLLNQLVALEGILSVRYPLYTAAVFSSACSRIFYTLVCLCVPIYRLFEVFGMFMNAYFLFPLLVFIVSVITCIKSCGVSCSAERHSHTSRKADRHILVVLMFNMLMLYMYLYSFTPSFHNLNVNVLVNIFHFSWLLMSVRLISNPLLCVLVCRQSLHL